MDKKQIERYIRMYVDRLTADIKPQQVILYGSFLTPRFSDGSDIDLVIVSEYFRGMDDDERLEILYRKTVHIPLDFHIYGVTPEELVSASPLTTLHEAIRHGVSFA